MSEYASRGSTHAPTSSSSYAGSVTYASEADRAKAQEAADRERYERATSQLDVELAAVRAAHVANDPERWARARAALDHQVAVARNARSFGDAERIDRQLQQAESLREAPLGYRVLAKEPELLAALDHDRLHGERLLRALFDDLATEDRTELTRRLHTKRDNDRLATAFSARLTADRRHRLLARLTDRQLEDIERPEMALVDIPDTVDSMLRRALAESTPSLVGPQLSTIFSQLDGTTRRELARRLQTYRPGQGDDIGARFAQLDGTTRAQLIASLHDAARAPRPDLPLTAPVYARMHLDAILDTTQQALVARGLPQPHARLSWASQHAAITALVNEIRAHTASDPGYGASRLHQITHPADLWTQIDQHRTLLDKSGTPRVGPDDIFHGPVGSRAWDPLVGVTVSTALDSALLGSISRMGARMRGELDREVRTNVDLVASTPLDRLVASLLAAPDLVVAGPAGNAPATAALRRVDFVWLGERDPTLWNWIHVLDPHPTAEDVAFTIYTDFADENGVPRSDQAYRIISAAPYFAIPVETARTFAGAWDHAPAAAKDPYRPRVETVTDAAGLAQSNAADDLALAQAPQVTTTDAFALDRIGIQLAFLDDRLVPWGAQAKLAGAQRFLERRRSETTLSTRWSAVAAVQETMLRIIATETSQFLRGLEERGITAADGLRPVSDVVHAYAVAAGVSHLARESAAALAVARQQVQLLPLSLAEDRIYKTRAMVREQQTAQQQSGRVEEGARETIEAVPLLAARSADLRAQAARGEEVPTGAIERLAVDADEMGLRARLVTLATHAHTLEIRARDAGLPEEKIDGNGFHTVQGVTSVLRSKIRSWTSELDDAHRWTGPDEGQTAAATEVRKLRRGIATVEQSIANFDRESSIGEFLNWAYESIEDHQLRETIFRLALEIGISLISGQLVSGALAAFRAIRLARAAVATGELIANAPAAGLGFRALEIAAHAGVSTATQGAFGRPAGLREFAENSLSMAISAAAMRPFVGLFRDVAGAEREVTRFARALQFVKPAARVALEFGIDMSASAAAHYITHLEQLNITNADQWVTQGVAMLAGRFVHGRTAGMQQRLEVMAEQYGAKKFKQLQSRVDELATRAATTSAETEPAKALKLLEDSQSLLNEELSLTRELVPDVSRISAIEAEIHALDSAVELPLHLLGLTRVVDGEIYSGTPAMVEQARAQATRMNLQLSWTRSKQEGVHHLHVGSRLVIVHENGVAPNRTLDDFLSSPMTDAERIAATSGADREDSMSILAQRDAIQAQEARSTRDTMLAIKLGKMPRYIARVGTASNYDTFARTDREFVFATEPADLRRLTAAEAVLKVGWDAAWAHQNIGKEIEITILDTHADVITANGSTSRVTLGNIEWRDMKRVALQDKKFIATSAELGITADDLPSLFDELATGWVPSHLTADIEFSPKATEVLAALYVRYSANRLYTSIGATMKETGELGARELMVLQNETGLKLTPGNHVKVSLGVLTASDFSTYFPTMAP